MVKITDSTIIGVLRPKLYEIFDKLSDDDLIYMYNALNYLCLSGFVMSFCLEILEMRGYSTIPKRRLTDKKYT